jgi:hypothetical protein
MIQELSFAEISSFSHVSPLWWQSSERIEIYAICSCQRGYSAVVLNGFSPDDHADDFSGLLSTLSFLELDVPNNYSDQLIRLVAYDGEDESMSLLSFLRCLNLLLEPTMSQCLDLNSVRREYA